MCEWIEAHPELYAWVILPGLIFLARVFDVSLGTTRVFFVSRGYKTFAALIGFWEVLIWLLAIGYVMQNLSNPMCVVAFALGFATGNWVGITLAEKLSLGVVLVRVITQAGSEELIAALKAGNYGITVVDGHGAFGPIKVIFTIVQRHALGDVVNLIKAHNPKAFYSVEDVSRVSNGNLAPRKYPAALSFLQVSRPFRKGK